MVYYKICNSHSLSRVMRSASEGMAFMRCVCVPVVFDGSLYNNAVGDTGAIALARSIKQNISLHTLE